MARTRTTKTAPEPAVEDNGDRDYSDVNDREPTWQAKAFASWLKDEAGITITAKQVQAVTSLRVPFRQSDFYEEAKEQAQADQEAEETPKAEAPKPTRSRRAKADQEPAKATTTRSRRTRKGKAEPEVTVAKDEEPAKPTRSRRTRRAAKPATDETSTTPEAPF